MINKRTVLFTLLRTEQQAGGCRIIYKNLGPTSITGDLWGNSFPTIMQFIANMLASIQTMPNNTAINGLVQGDFWHKALAINLQNIALMGTVAPLLADYTSMEAPPIYSVNSNAATGVDRLEKENQTNITRYENAVTEDMIIPENKADSANEATVINENYTFIGNAHANVFNVRQGDEIHSSGQGNDIFIFSTEKNYGAVYNPPTTISGGDWIDTLVLSGVDSGPSTASDWLLKTSDSYTINEQNKSLVFDNGNASGTITLADGSTIHFNEIDQIQWS